MMRLTHERKHKQGVKDRAWAWMMQQDKTFERRAVRKAVKAEVCALDHFFERLIKGGYLRLISSGEVKDDRVYEILKKQAEAPRLLPDGSPSNLGLGREQMWRFLKMSGGRPFTLQDMVIYASTDQVQVSAGNVKDYLQALARANYIKASGATQRRQYRFNPVMNTGPKPPIIQSVQQIYDQNLGKVVWRKGASDV